MLDFPRSGPISYAFKPRPTVLYMYTICIYATQKIVCFGNLWILFMRGSTWGMAIFTVDIHYANFICAISV